MSAERPPDGDPFAPLEEPGHFVDDDGTHYEDECELCVERKHSVDCACRCGRCCDSLLIEASLRDAEREPRIKELCGPIWDTDIELFEGRKEIGGYLLNSRDNGGACVFFDRQTRLCTIHETRPLVCRLFNCDEEQDRFRDDASHGPSAVRDE